MTRVFEALERAEREAGHEKTAEQVNALLGTGAATPTPVPRGTLPLPNEHVQSALLELFHSVNGVVGVEKGLLLQLAAPAAEVGASRLAYAMAATLAERLDRTVLYWCINHAAAAPLALPAVDRAADLRDVLYEGHPLDETLYQSTNPRLSVLTFTSNHQRDVPGMLECPGFAQTIQVLRTRFDVVLVDPLPARGNADALALAPVVHGTIVVVGAEETRWQVANTLKAKLENQGGRVLGAILNKRVHHIPSLLYKLLL